MILEFFKVLSTSVGTRARRIVAEMRGVGTTGNDDAAESTSGEVMHPIGFHARPKRSDTAEAVVFRDGDEVHVLFFVDKGLPAITDLEEGAAEAFSPAEPTARLVFRATGKVELFTKSGQDFVFNAGSTPVAKEGSQTAGHSHSPLAMNAGPYPVTGTLTTVKDTIDAGQGSQNFKVP